MDLVSHMPIGIWLVGYIYVSFPLLSTSHLFDLAQQFWTVTQCPRQLPFGKGTIISVLRFCDNLLFVIIQIKNPILFKRPLKYLSLFDLFYYVKLLLFVMEVTADQKMYLFIKELITD